MDDKLAKSIRWNREARSNLLIITILTAVNCLFSYIEYGRYYFCSIFSAYILFGQNAILTILSIGIMALFVVTYVFSKKKRGWLTAAVVMLSVDTLICFIFTVLSFTMFELSEIRGHMVVDMLIHIAMLVMLIIGWVKSKPYYSAQGETAQQPSMMNAPVANADDKALIECTAFLRGPNIQTPSTGNGYISFDHNNIAILYPNADNEKNPWKREHPEIKEQVRFQSSHITACFLLNEAQKRLHKTSRSSEILIHLIDNTELYVALSSAEYNRFYAEAQRHGIQIYMAQ